MNILNNIIICPVEKDVFLFIIIATDSVPSRHPPLLITSPTPIPRIIPPYIVASKISSVNSFTFENMVRKHENINIA